MARMSIDDSVLRDPRVLVLAKLCGWSRRETLGALLDVWAICYDYVTDVLPAEYIDVGAVLPDFAKHLVTAGLATECSSGGVSLKGVKQRIEYLEAKARAGRAGGRKSGESRKDSAKQKPSTTRSTPQAPRNPIPIPIASVPDQEREQPSAEPRPHRLDPSWKPSDSEANRAAQDNAKARGVDLDQELLALHDWARDSGKKGKDWDSRWRNWLRRAKPTFALGTWNGTRAPPQRLVMRSASDEPDLSMYQPSEAKAT